MTLWNIAQSLLGTHSTKTSFKNRHYCTTSPSSDTIGTLHKACWARLQCLKKLQSHTRCKTPSTSSPGALGRRWRLELPHSGSDMFTAPNLWNAPLQDWCPCVHRRRREQTVHEDERGSCVSAGPPSVSHSAWYFKGSLGFSLVGFDTPWSVTLDELLRACDCVRVLYRTRLVVKFHEGTVESASLIDTSRFSHAVFLSQDVTTGGRCVTYWHVPCGLAGSRLDRSWTANRPQVWSASLLEAMKSTRRAISGST